jgi:hypothetical protein
MATASMVNPEYNPTEKEDELLDVLKEGRGSGEPWGRANPRFLRERTGYERQQINYSLNQLTAAGWVRKITRGLYEFVEDPREEAETE